MAGVDGERATEEAGQPLEGTTIEGDATVSVVEEHGFTGFGDMLCVLQCFLIFWLRASITGGFLHSHCLPFLSVRPVFSGGLLKCLD